MGNTKKVKKGRFISIILVLILIGTAVFALPYINEYFDTTSEYGEEVVVVIPKGASSGEIGEILKENGLIKSVWVFRLRVHQSENGSKMNYGTFTLNKGMCIPDIIDKLAGQSLGENTIMFTVPEGVSVEWIALRAEELGFCTQAEFLAALNDDYDYAFIDDIPTVEGANYHLQGFLYPETYEFYTDATAHEIIDKMLGQFEKEYSAIENASDMSMYDIITVASLLEREALLEKEYATIAGVIYNRIDTGMKLQIDATIQYVITDGLYDAEVKKSDYNSVDSPYSTYKVSALPVGPICNPGIKTIIAAINPEEHNYLYYHTDNDKKDGSHIFTRTYEEHKATM